MIAVFAIVVSLIAISPALIKLDEIQAGGLISIVDGVALVITAIALHASELHRLFRLFKPTAFLLLLIPCIWMLLQVMPVSSRWLVHPVWVSASVALGQPLNGAISLDIGATLLSLALYCAVLATAVITAIVALNRQHAENILLLLTAIATVIATGLIGFDLGILPISEFEPSAKRADTINITAIGVVLSCAMAAQAYEQFDARKMKQRKMPTMLIVSISVAAAAFFICLSAIVICADPAVLVITLFGAGILMSTLAIRKWRLDPWGQAGIATIGMIAVIAFFATVPAKKDTDPTIALSTQNQVASVERMLSDGKLAGAGAGSFQSLLPIYRDIDQTALRETPTTAAAIAIEMGRPFLWISGITALFGASILFRRAMRRGRDYIYPSAGAGCIVTVLVLAFVNPGILDVTASLLIGAASGLAFAQSKSSNKQGSGFSLSDHPPLSTKKANRFGNGTLMNFNMPADIWLRTSLALFGAVLLMQASWILFAEKYQPNRIRFPVDQKIATLAQSNQNEIQQAATRAVVRGDLWADSAYSYAAPLWIDKTMGLDAANPANEDLLRSLTQSLRYSPHRGDIWLMFAAMAERYKWPNYQPNSLLKMSFYTAPNEVTLVPLRLNVALRTKGAIDDDELQDMIRRDITVVLSRIPALKPALAAAYRSASPQGKTFTERVITEIDPGYLTTVRAKYP